MEGKYKMSQTKKKERCKEILHSMSDYEFVTKEQFDFLLEFFATSYYFEYKTRGKKIVNIQKRPSGSYGNSCFFLIREDGSSTDISYTKISKTDDRKAKDVISALRHAIDKSIISVFRRNFTPGVYGGKYCGKVEDVDVDHYEKSFKELADEWIHDNKGIDTLSKFVNKTEDNSTETYFVDENLNESFRKFHNENTHLRFLPKEINRSQQ